jgi:membrane-associated phospholipid phosphatase
MAVLRDAFWGAVGAVPPEFWHAFTWLGDSGLLLPASVLIALLLWLSPGGGRWVAFSWCLAFGLGGAVIVASKLAFLGWGVGSARLNFTGFSGHTAIGTSVWSVALWMVMARRSPTVRRTAVAAGWALGAAIGASRLAIFAHSASEVVAGLLLGIAICLAFLWLVRRHPAPRAPWPVMLLGLLLPLAFQTPGTPAPTQDLLEAIAIRLAGVERAYTREDLLQL